MISVISVPLALSLQPAPLFAITAAMLASVLEISGMWWWWRWRWRRPSSSTTTAWTSVSRHTRLSNLGIYGIYGIYGVVVFIVIISGRSSIVSNSEL